MEFSSILHMLRTKKGLSQKELAQNLDVSQASINYWEKGQRTPSIEAAQKIADYFGVTLNYLMTGNEPNKVTLQQKNGKIETFDISRIVDIINQQNTKNFIETIYNNQEKREKLISEILSTHNYKIETEDIHWLAVTDHQGFRFQVSHDDFSDMVERCDKDIRYNIEKLLGESTQLEKYDEKQKKKITAVFNPKNSHKPLK